MSLGNFKQWDATTHLLEWLKSKTLTTPNAVEDVEPQELFHHYWQCQMYAHFGKVWQFFTKVNSLTIQSNNHTSWYIHKGVKNLCPKKPDTWMPIWRKAKGYILHNFSYMSFKKGKTVEAIKRLVFSWGERGWNEQV